MTPPRVAGLRTPLTPGASLPVVPHDLLEALADHVHAARFGDGLEGLAAGQGLILLPIKAPPCFEGARSSDGVLMVRANLDAPARRLVILRELAAHVLARHSHTPQDVRALALAIGAPRAVLQRLRAEGRLLPHLVAAETGLPRWAAQARLRILPTNH